MKEYKTIDKIILLDVLRQIYLMMHEHGFDRIAYNQKKSMVVYGYVHKFAEMREQNPDFRRSSQAIYDIFSAYFEGLKSNHWITADFSFMPALPGYYQASSGIKIRWSFKLDMFLIDIDYRMEMFDMEGVMEPHKYFWLYWENKSESSGDAMY